MTPEAAGPSAPGASPPADLGFDGPFRERLERLIRWRRDVRRFRRDPVDPALIGHLLDLACLAPSVGHSQPWRFDLVESPTSREAVRANFLACNRDALADYRGERARLYAGLKLAGLDEAPVHLAVFCDGGTTAGHRLGRKTMPETLRYSAIAAVHTLWLAARAWGLGVGWVSILDAARLRADLALPVSWDLVAYLCIGRPEQEQDRPELACADWQQADPTSRRVIQR